MENEGQLWSQEASEKVTFSGAQGVRSSQVR